eukprot:TRINITY_DN10679_c0_g1_i1.p1 TRINITY_DN10679_c0_g1~~TRINITY_DN10679_c0_g1_i1.p1  ORF type:complete len:828 (+),score=177.76 TRINITY_DN10679_c0_g1_i1:164-2647(+)
MFGDKPFSIPSLSFKLPTKTLSTENRSDTVHEEDTIQHTDPKQDRSCHASMQGSRAIVPDLKPQNATRLSLFDGMRTESESLERKLRMDNASASCHMIVPGLYLGGAQAADNPQIVDACKIKMIVNLAGNICRPHLPRHVMRQTLFLHDSPSQDLISFLRVLVPFIERCIEQGKSVLVHCQKGISRSSAVVIGYLMWKQRISFEEAFSHVRAQRPACAPNSGFIAQLLEWRKILDGDSCRDFLLQLTFHEPRYYPLILGVVQRPSDNGNVLDQQTVHLLCSHSKSAQFIWIGKDADANSNFGESLNEAKRLATWIAKNESGPNRVIVVRAGSESQEFHESVLAYKESKSHLPTISTSDVTSSSLHELGEKSMVSDGMELDIQNQDKQEAHQNESLNLHQSNTLLEFIPLQLEQGPLPCIPEGDLPEQYLERVFQQKPTSFISDFAFIFSQDRVNEPEKIVSHPDGAQIIDNQQNRVDPQPDDCQPPSMATLHFDHLKLPQNRIVNSHGSLSHNQREEAPSGRDIHQDVSFPPRIVRLKLSEDHLHASSAPSDIFFSNASHHNQEQQDVAVDALRKDDQAILQPIQILFDKEPAISQTSFEFHEQGITPRSFTISSRQSEVGSEFGDGHSLDHERESSQTPDSESNEGQNGSRRESLSKQILFGSIVSDRLHSPSSSPDGSQTRRNRHSNPPSPFPGFVSRVIQRSTTPSETKSEPSIGDANDDCEPEMYRYPDWEQVGMFDSDDLDDNEVFVLVPNSFARPLSIWVWVGSSFMEQDMEDARESAAKDIAFRFVADYASQWGSRGEVDVKVAFSGQEDEAFWELFMNG